MREELYQCVVPRAPERCLGAAEGAERHQGQARCARRLRRPLTALSALGERVGKPGRHGLPGGLQEAVEQASRADALRPPCEDAPGAREPMRHERAQRG